MTENIKVNGDRLWDSLMQMARIGATKKGGSCRLALTDEDREGRDLFVDWAKDAGCSIDVDDMGNIFARRPGKSSTRDPIAAGSHLDTQPHGGKFDGVYGVLAALEVIRALNDHGVETDAPIEAVVWTNEEGARFAPAMIASGVFAGLFEKDYAWNLVDADGISLGDELSRIGYRGTSICGEHPLGAIFEAHIEQGPILERDGNVIGVVVGGQGQRWYDVTCQGQDSHAGSTPMPGRRDALVAASQIISDLRSIALDRAPYAVATVGNLTVHPNSRNTIPGGVVFSVDLRNPDDTVLAEMDAAFRECAAKAASAESVSIDVDQIWHCPPVEFDKNCVAAVRQGAEQFGFNHQDIVSGAGHDACQMVKIAPTGMIFVPCADGLSHNEEESAKPEDLEAGCNVLLHAMTTLAT